jgi:protein with PEP-CTERM/exosortase system signal
MIHKDFSPDNVLKTNYLMSVRNVCLGIWHWGCFILTCNMRDHMKTTTIPSKKLALIAVAVCAAMLAFTHNANATRRPLPSQPVSEPVSVPDGGTTVMLLGTALGALGLARRFFMG